MSVINKVETSPDAKVPYQLPFPPEVLAGIVQPDCVDGDERRWVPIGDGVWMQPLCLSVAQGYWVNLVRVRKSGVLARHRHPGPVHAYVLKGSWRYMEHDWIAQTGTYAYEPAGETHTLVVPDDVEEMITLFHVSGSLIYMDPYGNVTGYEDVFTKIETCRKHYEAVGLGADYVDQFIR
jgi:2,4'-dihydroxyacetophenone dioxygenase